MTAPLGLWAVLVAMGVGWGLTIPLAKIAVSTGHMPMGLIFWQLVVVTLFLGTITMLRGKALVFRRRHLKLLIMVALCGAVLPDIFYYLSAIYLPGGIMSIAATTTVMFSLPIAILLGNERFEMRRFFGLIFGFIGVLLLVAPDASLPEGTAAFWVLIALCGPALYATEGNLVMKWGTQDLDPLQVVVGASAVGLVIAAPAAWVSGQWVNPFAAFGRAETALATGAALHALVYATYVWLVGRAGSVFAAQSAYVVTGFGVLSSMVMLSESYSLWVWAAMGVMMLGMALVQPRPRIALAPDEGIGDTTQTLERGAR
ncbi:DMT family transporter [Roseovarius faecimaris]|uniref:DMT family transporter n=1 Tax=Roseovarius faecimaris TaxID=2494550 RepID=A0A6I6ILE1_9RHOB|nr:DMT family transporter [Roseovarius faecimaris]QGX97880.1 DMT family transporter [Roseovarius faecimaris]